ncbi:MAG: hypothetical protein PHX69_00355 [Simplicispira sp.]|uniref:hypothetical protein n=1 Tax=Simplicispira sp. TaxID=2015802 RepID=UPI002584DB70|nr:hypothetical protein [Simplicispira sp.]MDD2690218.1 hypothetical protein [Simplicispira sp.]
MSTNTADPKTNRDRAYEAICELHEAGQPVTRDTIAVLTGLKRGVVDEQISVLKERELIYAPVRGSYRPIKQLPPARPISKTVLPDGWVLWEIGDQLLRLTPHEDRVLGSMAAMSGMQLSQIELGQHTGVLVNTVREELRRLKQDLGGA